MSQRRTGTADLPLHYGRTPRWLFQRMTRLARAIAIVLVEEGGPCELLRRLADPYWFQAFGCVLGFDWHSSGLTTTACGALKEGLREVSPSLGVYVAGGKGSTSRRAPQEIMERGADLSLDPQVLVYASRMVAKVDSNALQDGYQIYHHTFVFDREGHWAVVQQGMNEATGYARRYHWLSEGVRDFVDEPHAAICSEQRGVVLNMVAHESERARAASAELAREKPDRLLDELFKLREPLFMPAHHAVSAADINPKRLASIFLKTYERQPENFEQLLALKGVGAKTIRALSLLAELLYGTPVSTRDPARFSFAHGGKDGTPYPVDRVTYERSIDLLERAIKQAQLGNRERLEALRRLAIWQTDEPGRVLGS